MQILIALKRIAADLQADCEFWIRYRSLRPDTRRFLLLHYGYVKLAIYRGVLWLCPFNVLLPFTVRLIQHSSLFDAEFYLRVNADVAAAGHNPLQHFLRYGDQEGRNPMPLFDPRFYRAKAGKFSHGVNSLVHYTWIGCHSKVSPSAWFDAQYYLQHNRDVARRGFDPLWHYLQWGGLEGRSPNPSFDGSFYLRTYPDVQAARINPLLHYIDKGRLEGRLTRPLRTQADEEHTSQASSTRLWSPGDWDELQPSCHIDKTPVVAVIVPVYRDRSLTWKCLASVLTATCQTPFRLVVIDDESPESELSADLAEMAARGWIELYTNPNNLGFVASVNHGMEVAGVLDVVLLNADTEVYSGWLDRLRSAAYRHPRTASVTPLSNNATIASYPRFLHDTPYPLEISYRELDQLTAQANANTEVEVPTGVGFCMYLRREALDDIGFFDEKTFGKGYGEENDWCQRAINKGWRNIVATDIFVRHFGSASFKGEKAKRVAQAMQVLAKKYPFYHDQVQTFIAQDPLKESRQRLDFARLQYQAKAENVLIVCHNRGGGAERHVQEDTERLLSEGKGVFYLRPVRDKPEEVRITNAACRQLLNMPSYPIREAKRLAVALSRLNISYIHNHGLVDMVADAPRHLLALSQQMNVPLDEDIHDYKVICPTINLVDENGFYCGEPQEMKCNHCLSKRASDFGVNNIQAWREMHHVVLKSARTVFVPDEDVALRLGRYYPDIRFQIIPHERINNLGKLHTVSARSDESLHVVVIGAISKIKGFSVLQECAKEAKKSCLPLKFTLLGYSIDDNALEAAGVYVTGRYHEKDAVQSLHNLKPDVVWLPSIWPETYSYTLTIAIKAGYPSVVFDIGAPAARLRRNGNSNLILPLGLAKSTKKILDTFLLMKAA